MGMLGFIGVGLGLLCLHIRLAGTPASRYGSRTACRSRPDAYAWQPGSGAAGPVRFGRPSLSRQAAGSKRNREWPTAGVCWIRRI
jgi:hypothetical protein